jgi:hypothetical protein
MIKQTGSIVLTPTHLKDQPIKKWLEVFPKTPKEIAWYASLDHSRTTYGETEPRYDQSPLLIDLLYARELGLK